MPTAPLSLTESAVAEWLRTFNDESREGDYWGSMSRAVLALVEAKVRDALGSICTDMGKTPSCEFCAAIVSRVMGRPA